VLIFNNHIILSRDFILKYQLILLLQAVETIIAFAVKLMPFAGIVAGVVKGKITQRFFSDIIFRGVSRVIPG